MTPAVANRKVLIVEDEAFIADLYKKEFLRHGASVDVVANGAEALGRLAKGKYQAVLVDLLMPVMDGYELLRKLREQREPMPPMIVVSNVSEKLMWEQCKKLGAADFVTKSDADASDVWKTIEKHLPSA